MLGTVWIKSLREQLLCIPPAVSVVGPLCMLGTVWIKSLREQLLCIPPAVSVVGPLCMLGTMTLSLGEQLLYLRGEKYTTLVCLLSTYLGGERLAVLQSKQVIVLGEGKTLLPPLKRMILGSIAFSTRWSIVDELLYNQGSKI